MNHFNDKAIADHILSEIHGIRSVMVVGVGFGMLCVVAQVFAIFFVWMTFKGPFQQLDELAHTNQAIITATCDSTFYTSDELLRRTPMQKRRLDLVCQSRRRIDSLIRAPHDTPARIP